MNKKLLQFALVGLCLISTPFLAMAGLTNADVIKMVKAGLSTDVIVTTIRSNSGNTFDKSVDGLIALKEAKVPDVIISAIVGGVDAVPAPKQVQAAETVKGVEALAKDQQIGQEGLILVENGNESLLLFRMSESRTQSRAMGMGGFAEYSVLRGTKSDVRLKTRTPSFIIAAPKNVQVQSYITLASFLVRKNGNRECVVGGGAVMGVSSIESGVHKDRVVAITIEKLADQSRAKEGCILYSVIPKNALASGEYAFVLPAGQAGGSMPNAMMQVACACCDFGVD